MEEAALNPPATVFDCLDNPGNPIFQAFHFIHQYPGHILQYQQVPDLFPQFLILF